jgi:hypothetical protein
MAIFDATITLHDGHLAMAGLSGPEAAAAVRRAVQGMEGAGWIDVEALSYPPHLPGWVVIFPAGRSGTPKELVWRDLLCQVEAVATAALAGAHR